MWGKLKAGFGKWEGNSKVKITPLFVQSVFSEVVKVGKFQIDLKVECTLIVVLGADLMSPNRKVRWPAEGTSPSFHFHLLLHAAVLHRDEAAVIRAHHHVSLSPGENVLSENISMKVTLAFKKNTWWPQTAASSQALNFWTLPHQHAELSKDAEIMNWTKSMSLTVTQRCWKWSWRLAPSAAAHVTAAK